MKKIDLILDYLKTNRRATIRDLHRFVNNPPEFIRQLKMKGHNIETEDHKTHSVYVLK